jgi:hypothetical protein
MGREMELFTLFNAPSRDQARHAATLVTSCGFFPLEKLVLRPVLAPNRLRVPPGRRVPVPSSRDHSNQAFEIARSDPNLIGTDHEGHED